MNDENVKAIVGVAYQNFSKKLQALLRTPSNLYIWTNIEEKSRINTYSKGREADTSGHRTDANVC